MNFFMIVYNTTKMSSELVLFEAVAAGAIETLFDRENKPWFSERMLGSVPRYSRYRTQF